MTVPDKTVIVVMGVAGSGKTTIAALLAQDLGWKQTEADDLHGPENVAKMAAGIPLTDSDRAPWLQRISQRIDETEENQVVTCSALRRSYRDILRTANARVRFLHLHGSPDTLASRIGARTDHFMPASMLTSQMETLEPPTADEDGVIVDIDGTPTEIVQRGPARPRPQTADRFALGPKSMRHSCSGESGSLRVAPGGSGALRLKCTPSSRMRKQAAAATVAAGQL
jgi:gluconokinase